MKIIQECEVYINIECWELDKMEIASWLKGYFNNEKNLNVYGEKIKDIEITYDCEELISLDITVDVNCTFEPGCPSTFWVPEDPPAVYEYYTSKTFKDWLTNIINSSSISNYDIDIEIDEDSYIPTEEELIQKFFEEEPY